MTISNGSGLKTKGSHDTFLTFSNLGCLWQFMLSLIFYAFVHRTYCVTLHAYHLHDSLTDVVAMDCEMVGVSSLGNKSALGRVALVVLIFLLFSVIRNCTVTIKYLEYWFIYRVECTENVSAWLLSIDIDSVSLRCWKNCNILCLVSSFLLTLLVFQSC